MNKEDCIFCKIVKGEIPSAKIGEDENFMAFLDVNPINKGHVLLIPKKHEEYLFDLEDKDYIELLLKAKEISKILKIKLLPKKVGMAVEGISIPHLHIHLVPVNNINELNPERAKHATQEELQEVARLIKQ